MLVNITATGPICGSSMVLSFGPVKPVIVKVIGGTLVVMLYLIAIILAQLFVALTIHELGHWSAAVILKRPLSSVNIGLGPVIFEFLARSIWFRIRLLPFRGSVVICFPSKRRWKEAAIYGAGPAANIVGAFALLHVDVNLATLSLTVGLYNLWPFKGSDGAQLIKYLRNLWQSSER
jgi:hypothetical protein